jgi:opacity protein-like surface antigen
MRTKFATILAAAFSLGVVQAASAADMPTKAPIVQAPMAAPYSWTGFYVGISGGGAFGTTGASHTGLPNTGALAIVASRDFNLDHNLNGWLGGGLIGYNYQMGQWLWGIEADFSGANIHGSGTVSGVGVAQRNGGAAAATNFVTAGEKIDFFATVRGRLGMLATPNFLFYATGGLAVGDVKYNGQFHYATPVDYIVSDSATRVGWTVGAGLEYLIMPLWTVRAEYLYYDLGNHSVVSGFGVPATPPFQSQFDFHTHGSIARAALTYKLGGP